MKMLRCNLPKIKAYIKKMLCDISEKVAVKISTELIYKLIMLTMKLVMQIGTNALAN